jgi:CRP-like cAMP-binding protein
VSESRPRTAPEGGDGLDPVLREAHQRCLEAGAVVFDEGDSGGALYLIRSGAVEVTRRGPAGARCVARLGPGELFGEQGTLVAGPRRSRATVTRDAELLELDTALLEEMCLERADIALRVSRALAARAQSLEQRLASLEGEDGLRAMVRVLIRLARPCAEGSRIEATLRLLAGESGLGLLDAHRAIQRLVERRLVRLVEDVLIIADLDALSGSLDAPA